MDIDDMLNPLDVRGQLAAVGLAGTIALDLDLSSLMHRAGCTKGRLDIVKGHLELVWTELLELAAEKVAHEYIDVRLRPLDLCVSFALGNHHVDELARLLERQRT